MTVIKPNAIAGINSITVASGSALAVHKADGTLIQTIAGTSGVSTFSAISVGSATTSNSAEKSINIGLGASISQHNDNSLSFGTNGDERFQVNDSGKILIATTTTSEAHVNQDELIIGSTSDDANHGITIVTPSNRYGTVAFSDGSGGTSQGLLEYNHSGDFFRIYTGGTGEKLRVTSGRVSAVGIVSATDGFEVGTAATIKSNGNATFSGIVTATAFKGDGSGLSGVTAVTINNNGVNRVITGSDTANTLEAKSDLIFGADGDTSIFRIAGGSSDISSSDHVSVQLEFKANDPSTNSTNNIGASIDMIDESGNGSYQALRFKTFRQGQTPGLRETVRFTNDGNIKLGLSGAGIDFSNQTASSATGATASAEVLDHYEEGTWTPTVTTGTVSGGATGRYVRIGDFVLIYVIMNSFSDTTSNTPIQVGGVPFACAGQATGSFYPRRMTMNGTPAGLCVMGSSSSTLLEPQQGSDGNNMGYHPKHSDFQQTAAYMNFSICYRVT